MKNWKLRKIPVSTVREKSAIFIVMPEWDPGKFFMVSLIIQQLYLEILAVADENGGKLKNRCVFYCDEFGTLPKIADRTDHPVVCSVGEELRQRGRGCYHRQYSADDFRRVRAQQHLG